MKGSISMPFRHYPRWFPTAKRQEQLDAHIDRTGIARFGTRTYRTQEKARAVIRHFDRVAPKYDFMNSLLSLGIQHVWKRAAVRMLGLQAGERVLDVCGGTGDLAILASRRVGYRGRVVVYDFNRKMMLAGLPKIAPFPALANITHIQGDAEQICFADNSFDAVMVGFGIRNVTHLQRGLGEMHRVLKPGGRLLCLEFSRPHNPFFRQLYDFYSFNIMPFLGRLIAGSAQSYTCLSETIRMFPLPRELTDVIVEIGFSHVRYRAMTNGIAVAHVGIKASI